jgi:hypothetical protein
MAQPRKISKARVDSLKPGELAWDAEVGGFGVRCQRRDRVYVVKYRTGGPQRWFTIGKHGSPWSPELARREAKRILGLVADGKDPADKKQKDRSGPTISALADRFVAEHVETKSKDRTHTEYKRLIERIVKPRMVEPTARVSAGTCSVRPSSRSNRAVLGTSLASPRMLARARPAATPSNSSPTRNRRTTMAASSVSPIITAPTAATVIKVSMVNGDPASAPMMALRATGMRPTLIASRKAHPSVAGTIRPTR